MNRNRLIQFLAVAVFLLAVTGAGWLAVPIDQSRQALGLGFQTTAGRAIDPSITIPTAALGSFRGVAVVTLWIRAIRLQDEGKFFEANQLARMITTLQPRFPRVWQYQAWNMAYNISVATHTREERWGWVNKGIVLLRDKGIVYNPTAVTLYRELGWFFFHKIGQFMDDAHWYYRDQLAMQWHELLGAAPSGAMAEEVIDRFRVIVEAPETLSQLMDQEARGQGIGGCTERLDYDFDESLLRKIGYVQMLSPAQVLRLVQSEQMTDDGERKLNPRLVSVMTNPDGLAQSRHFWHVFERRCCGRTTTWIRCLCWSLWSGTGRWTGDIPCRTRVTGLRWVRRWPPLSRTPSSAADVVYDSSRIA